MRMFLVVMCDMFLLLYLTALSEMQSRPLSDLTVEDYRLLEQAQKESRETASTKERELAAREEELRRREEELQKLSTQLTAAQERSSTLEQTVEEARREAAMLAEAKEERAKAEAEARAELERLAAERAKIEQEAKAKLEQLAQERAKAAEEAARLSAQVADTETMLREREAQARAVTEQLTATEAERAKLQVELEERRRLEEEERQRKEELARQAEEALAEAKKAREEAEAAAAEAEKAQQDRNQALALAQQAREREFAAAQTAQIARDAAHVARASAARASQEAEQARRQQEQAVAKVQAITQQADQAYRRNVQQNVRRLEIRIKRDAFIGSSREEVTLSGIPVRYGNRSLIFVPLEHTAIERGSSAKDYERLSFTIDGTPAAAVYAPPAGGSLLAIELAGAIPGAKPLPPASSLRSYMPTLIAVRNGSPLTFGNRVRSLSEDRFIFQRDRLTRRPSGILEYQTAGFRGTGDFGEQLLPGDQVLDLEGNFLGVAVGENRLQPVPSITGWTRIALQNRPAREVAGELLQALRVPNR